MPARSRPTEPLYRIKADLFKCLAHPTRIQVLEVLAAAGDEGVPVTRLLDVTGCEASQLSQHLAVLRRTGVVTSSRTGNAVDYWLAQPLVAELLVVARAFLLASLRPGSDQLRAARGLPPLPGASPKAILDAVAVQA
ncbi:ArsR/SmtB family transcription factor [Amycolatopsis eburnea]|uniref:Transcriptional regulator n=1 Tax=Amycolatopsis eburnea TaxID=2267691 RepID=A0A3R9FIL2_9PSEU|nr:metalloregulator ArsR/SmtB family transcription factor [Amycolatopsis eburnea]RSD11817.1 transcriptional regulator [Amycolatopsis eburnea]